MTRSREAVLRLFKVGHNRAESFEPAQAYFPGYAAPVVRKAGDGERELVMMNWGFILPQKDKAPRKVTNARDDNKDSRFWKDSFEQRRCLVPVSSYCEPNDTTPCVWHWFSLLQQDEPRPLFAFPGIWRKWNGPVKKNGPSVEQTVFSFFTTMPNPLTASINHERMPALLNTEAEFEQWLSGTPDEAFSLVRSFDANRMRIVQKGLDKKDLLAA